MSQQGAFDFTPDGKRLRDEGAARVLANAGATWADTASLLLQIYAHQRHYFIGEEFRHWAVAVGLRPPHHPNAWGAVLLGAARAKPPLIVCTDHTRQMVEPRSHARRTPVWRSLITERDQQ